MQEGEFRSNPKGATRLTKTHNVFSQGIPKLICWWVGFFALVFVFVVQSDSLCQCREAALCETGETQGVTLEGSVCFDFLKAEDRGANEGLETQKSRWWFALQGSCPRG